MGIFVLRRLGQPLLVLGIASVIIFVTDAYDSGRPRADHHGQRILPRGRGPAPPTTGSRSSHHGAVSSSGSATSCAGEFGYSYLNHERVSVLLWDAFLPTLFLVIGTTIVGLLIALPSGIIAAIKKDTAWDYGSMGFAIVGYSMPSFWKGIMLIWIFGVYLRWFPTMGYVHPWDNLGESLWKLTLPSITLGTFFSGLVARITRSSLLEVLDQDYIKAARGTWRAAGARWWPSMPCITR